MNQLNIIIWGPAMTANLYLTERHPEVVTSTSALIEAKFAIPAPLTCTARFQRGGSVSLVKYHPSTKDPILDAASNCGSTKC